MDEVRRNQETEVTGDSTGGVIPYKNPAALFAYYCGVFSLIPCFALVLGPVAVILGIVGLVYRRKHPQTRGMAHAWIGIVLGTLTVLLNIAAFVVLVSHS